MPSIRPALALLAFACLPAASTASPPTDLDQLPGLWGYEITYGPRVQGVLTIDGREAAWDADIAGLHTTVERKGPHLSFALPGNNGAFRGEASADGQRVEGFWIQPPGQTLNAAYATPVRLHAIAPNVWQGRVEPLADKVSLYLQIDRDKEGRLHGFIRNPEFNFGGRRPYAIRADGDALLFENTKRKNDVLHARIDPDSGHLQVDYQGVGVWEFSRREPAQAPGFHPRAGMTAVFRDHAPVPTDDGWATGSLAQADMDAAPIAALIERLQAPPADERAPYVHALLIARHGKLVVDEYFHGYGRDDPHDSRSAGKTLAPVLVGLARKQGNFDADTRIQSLLPAHASRFRDDARKQAITVRDLMTMTSGLACDDNDDASPGNEDTMQQQQDQKDWVAYTLALPMARAPGGTQSVYCSAGINLLGAIVSARTGMALPEFFEREYAAPLGIRRYHMNLMPDGNGYLGGGIHLRPRDALKLGQLYLDGGRWHGRQIVDPAWVQDSTTRHAQFEADHGYGYAWHEHTLRVGDRTYREYAAEGNGGQFVIVVPELDLVVAISAGNYGDFQTWSKFQDFVPASVIPAITRRH
jgi:CubicO group peptidase (beta-lactamase class C family)